MWYVYTIATDTVTYVGMTDNLFGRWAFHFGALSRDNHSNKQLTAALHKADQITLTVVGEFPTKAEAVAYELELHAQGYLGAQGIAGRIPVIDNLGNIYPSAAHAAKDMGVSPSSLQNLIAGYGRNKQINGRFFEKYTGQSKARDPLPSEWLTYCSNGKVYTSVQAASRDVGITPARIYHVIKGKCYSVDGLVFARSQEELTQRMTDLPPPGWRKNAKKVLRSDGEVFQSIAEAARSVDGDIDTIKICCRNPKRKHKGYHWSFV